MKLFDKKILDYDYGDDEEEMIMQSPEFQTQQNPSTAIEGLDRFVLLSIILIEQMFTFEYFNDNDTINHFNYVKKNVTIK